MFTEPGCGDGSPQTILRELDRLMVEQDADVLVGPASGDEAIAATKWARSHPGKTIVLGTAASQEPTMQIARRNVFRYHGDAAQWHAGLGEYVYRKHRWRTVAVIADDYGPGWTAAAGFIADFCASGGTVATASSLRSARRTTRPTSGNCRRLPTWMATSGRWAAVSSRRRWRSSWRTAR